MSQEVLAVRDLAKRKLGQLTRTLESAQAKFRTEVEALAERARAEILPYFRERGYDYRAGNGTWFISRPAADDTDDYKPELHVEDDELPANIRELLTLEVGAHDCLGFYIRDINRGEW